PDVIGGVVLLGLAAFYLAEAARLPYLAGVGVGEGFLPTWLGVSLALAAALLALQGLTAREPETLSEATDWPRSLALLAGLAALALLMDDLGALPSLLLFSVGAMRLLGSRWPTTLIVSVGLVVLIALLFRAWLGVPLPSGPLGM
ncbi:MAG TPA: tripartite tricarboxylate transporter TctB family protein, partial [Chloroflexota bacterium]